MADIVKIGYLLAFLFTNTCSDSMNSSGVSESALPSDTSQGVQQPYHPLDLDRMMVRHNRYRCHVCEPPECSASDASGECRDALYCYKATVRGADGELQRSRGCTGSTDHYQLTCRTNQQPGKRYAGQLNITCCRGDFCNDGPFPSLSWGADDDGESTGWAWRGAAGAGGALLAAIGLVLAGLLALKRARFRLRSSRVALLKLGADSTYFTTNLYNPPVTYVESKDLEGSVRAVAAGESTLREYLERSATSGSGAGLPLMVQRTLARQVTLSECVGKGRYGSVWRGRWCADEVAVKMFFSREEASWRRETELYGAALLRHDHLLAYVGSDVTARAGCTQLWLITHYHPNGSLFEYLSRTTLTTKQMLRLCLTAVSGLLHLHTDIHGTQGKPAIAHRDIKSKNVLVKSNGECCLADLGLALPRHHPAPDPRQGTRRYMSPEILDHSMNTECFESYLRCDIYAMALVMWEVTRRVSPGFEPQLPYHGSVPSDPSYRDMQIVVCEQKLRPEIPDSTHPSMVGVAKLIKECWHENPSARLPALRLKKSLYKLYSQDTTPESPEIPL